jgi:ADP-ribose pyrophosphatase YjhB (NUDIX family)
MSKRNKEGLIVAVPFDEVLYPHHYEPERFNLRVTSVAVWCVVHGVPGERRRHVLLTQQADQAPAPVPYSDPPTTELPWGPPAGRVEIGRDKTPQDTAVRELLEETGINLDPRRLQLLSVYFPNRHQQGNTNKAGLIYVADIYFPELGKVQLNPQFGGSFKYEPPNNVNQDEIAMLALRPLRGLGGPQKGWQEVKYRPTLYDHGWVSLFNAGFAGPVQLSFPFYLDQELYSDQHKRRKKRKSM